MINIYENLLYIYENLLPRQNMGLLRKLSASFFLIMRIMWHGALSFALALRKLGDKWETTIAGLGSWVLYTYIFFYLILIFFFIFLIQILCFNLIGIIVYILLSDTIFFVGWVEHKHTNSMKNQNCPGKNKSHGLLVNMVVSMMYNQRIKFIDHQTWHCVLWVFNKWRK